METFFPLNAKLKLKTPNKITAIKKTAKSSCFNFFILTKIKIATIATQINIAVKPIIMLSKMKGDIKRFLIRGLCVKINYFLYKKKTL